MLIFTKPLQPLCRKSLADFCRRSHGRGRRGHTPLLIGARVALQEFFATAAASRFLPVYLESGQTLLICLR